MKIEAKVKIELGVAEVRMIIAEQISKELHCTVSPDQIELQYDGNYDETEFDGVKVELTDEQAGQYLLSKKAKL